MNLSKVFVIKKNLINNGALLKASLRSSQIQASQGHKSKITPLRVQNILNRQHKSAQRGLLPHGHSLRFFSSAAAAASDSGEKKASIFDNADFFKEDAEATISSSITTGEEQQYVQWYDGNDSLSTLTSMLPKDVGNIPQGVPTYGLWEYIVFLDDLFYNAWITCADTGSMGLCLGLMATTFVTRVGFMPVGIYSQMVGHKMKLLGPDTEEMSSAMKRYSKQGNKEAAKIERQKMKQMRRTHGIYPMISMLNIFQMPVHMVYISMINRLSYDFYINPAILTDGMLWFKDLSSPDPTGILPVLGGMMSLLNIMSTSTTSSSAQFRKFAKFIRVMPLISIPIWMTFPAAFNVYWLVTASCQLLILNLFRFRNFRLSVGIPDFLPGTKLERLNVKNTGVVLKPKIFTQQQSKKKLMAVKAKKQKEQAKLA